MVDPESAGLNAADASPAGEAAQRGERRPRGRTARPAGAAPTLKQRWAARALRVAMFCFRVSPRWLAYGVARALAPILYWVTQRREPRVAAKGRGMVRNQRIAFRDAWDEEFSRRHMKAWARHMCYLFVDFCRIPRIDASNFREIVDCADYQVLRDLLDEGKGLVAASGHVGMWEMCGHVASLIGLGTMTVVRPIRNPAIDAVVNGVRACGGQGIVPKWGALWPLRKTLARNEIVGIAADENDENSRAFVPFLGTAAASNTSAAFLATRTGAPIVVVSCQRLSPGRFKFHVWDVIHVEKGKVGPERIEELTARIHRGLSRAVQTYPEQWVWGTRRFRTRPAGEVLGADGLPPCVGEPLRRPESGLGGV